jgi:hypothetical protein
LLELEQRPQVRSLVVRLGEGVAVGVAVASDVELAAALRQGVHVGS